MSARFSLHGVCHRALPPIVFLMRGRQILGRSSACDIAIKDSSVSRRHAELVVTESGVVLADLGSCNGTFLQGRRVQTCQVTNGQSVRFGQVTFVLVAGEGARQEADSEVETDAPYDARGQKKKEEYVQSGLSPAQERVFQLLIAGFGEKQISTRLELSRHTVHNHVRAIYHHYFVHSRAELLARFLQPQRDQGLPPA